MDLKYLTFFTSKEFADSTEIYYSNFFESECGIYDY